MRDQVLWDIPSDVREVEAVCRDARKLLAAAGQSGLAFTVDLLLREFINNAIIHGNRSDFRNNVSIVVRVSRVNVLLSVYDRGRGFDWRTKMHSAFDDTATGGRGLAIGARYARRMRFNGAGNRVVLAIRKTQYTEGTGMNELTFARDGDRVRVTLGEMLTAADVPSLQPALKKEIDGGAREIVFDLAQTVSIDSTGIGLLIAANNSLLRAEGSLRLVNVSPDIMKLLQSMRLAERLHAAGPGREELHG